MSNLFTPARLRVLSGLFTNLAAAWIGTLLVFSTVSDLVARVSPETLLVNGTYAIVALGIAFICEEKAT